MLSNDDHHLAGGLKFVRWGHTPKSRRELTVQRGDEVEIIVTGSRDVMYKVKLDKHTGYIPEKCFYRRRKANVVYEPQFGGEIAVNKGEVVGIIAENVNVGGRSMCKIMKDGGIEGTIPQHCLYRHFEVFAEHTRENQEQLSVKRGDTAGLIEADNFDVYWKVYYKGKIGQVPSRCFEPPSQVRWDHEARREDEISVRHGDTVTLVDHHRPITEGIMRVKVRLDDKVGFIPQKCFEVPATVYWDNEASSDSELFVRKGDIVGLIEISAGEDRPSEGYLKVRLNEHIGLVPRRCFEIPAKVVRNYKAAKASELTVKEGQDVRVVDATAYIRVRYDNSQGDVPFSCINTDVQEIFRLLQKDDDHSMPQDGDENMQLATARDQSGAVNLDVDDKALCAHLDLSSKEDATYYLKDIKPDPVGEIGLNLGLSFSTLRALDEGNLREAVVTAWLQRKDQVEKKTGTPTWKSLGGVLQKLGHSEAAGKISKDNTRLDMAKLTLVRFDVGDKMEELKIIDHACTKWHTIGTHIGMSGAKLDSIENQRPNMVERFKAVLDFWTEDGGKHYPATWLGLRCVLADAEMSVLANKIRSVMGFI